MMKQIVQYAIFVFLGLEATFGLPNAIRVIIPINLNNQYPTWSRLSNDDSPPDVLIGLKAKVFNSSEINSPELSEAERVVLNNFEFPVVAISLDYIYFSPSIISSDLDSLCIEKIYIQDDDNEEEGMEFFRKEQILFESGGADFCLTKSKQYYLAVEPVAFRRMVLNKTNIDSYYFPFDSRKVNFNLLLDGYGKKNDERVEFPRWNVSLEMVSDEWRENVDVSQGVNSFNKIINIIFKRSITFRILFWVLPLIVLISIVSLVLIESRGSILEVSMGMLSLWSIQDILVPDYIDGPTIVIVIVTCLYILLGFSLVISMIKRRSKRSKKVDFADLVSEIPYRKGKGELVNWANSKMKTEGMSSLDIARAFFTRAESSSSQNQKNKLKMVGEIFLYLE